MNDQARNAPPLELIDHIISFVPDSKRLYFRLSLVCRDWMFLTYPRQFRRLEVHIGSPPELRDDFRKIRNTEELLAFLLDSPNVRRCVRELELIYVLSSRDIAKQRLAAPGVPIRTFKAILSNLKLDALHFNAPFDPNSLNASVSQPLAASGSLELRDLRIWCTNYPGLSHGADSTLAILLGLFTHIDRLTVSSTSNASTVTLTDMTAQISRLPVRELCIWRVNSRSLPEVLSCLASTLAPEALQNLTFSSYLAPSEDVISFINDLCQQVTELTFNSYSWSSFPLSAFRFLPKLSLLRIPINNTPDLDSQLWADEWNRSTRFLATDTAHIRLRQLHISFRYTTEVIDQVTSLDWDRFERAVDANPQLELIHFVVLGYSDAAFARDFPRVIEALVPVRHRSLLSVSTNIAVNGFPRRGHD